MEEALSKMVSELEIPISYSNNIIPAGTYVSYRANGVPLKRILDKILAGTSINYKTLGPQIILFVPKVEPEEKFTLSGYIKDVETGESIISAVVYSPSLEVGAYTNEFGFYSLTFNNGGNSVKDQ